MSSQRTGRRAALRTLLAVPLGLAAAAMAACQSTVARLRGWRLTPIATLEEVPVGSGYRTTAGEKRLVVVNEGGEIRTFLGICTHEGCPLGWNPTQHLIRCPCHGSAFNTKGEVVNGPALLPLTRLETIVDGRDILLVDR